jgi:cysteine synthase B
MSEGAAAPPRRPPVEASRDPPGEPAAAALARLLARTPPAVASVVDLIGDTPLVRLGRLEERPGVEIWGKCEFKNPGGSVKDRAAWQMIKDALADGRLDRRRTLIDSTSGNTGVAYSMIGAALGLRVALVMPANVSAPRKQIAAAYGTEVILSSEMEGSDGAIRRVRELVAQNPERYFYPDQYSNESNPRAHSLTTAAEIIAAVGDRLTHFVAGIGTSGTVMGCGRRLHQWNPAVRVVAVEPDDALHGLEGLKHMATSIRPGIWRPDESVDEIVAMPTEEAWEVAERMTRLEGIFVGHSAGASVAAALRLARGLDRGCIVAILPDRGDRYFNPQKWEKKYVW